MQVGNGLYPTASNAAESGVTERQLAAVFRRGLDADYRLWSRPRIGPGTCLGSGREIRVTDAHGTDFSAKLGGREVRTSDGVISDADLKQSGGSSSVFLPAGEVYVIAQPGSARGTLSMRETWSQHAKIPASR